MNGFGGGCEDQETIWGIVSLSNAALMGQPLAEVGDQRVGLRLTNGEAFFGRVTPHAGFDLVNPGNAAQALGGDLGAVFLIDVVQLAARMRPAVGQCQRRATHTAGFGQGIISGIAVDLQDAIEARQDVHCMAATAPRRIGEDNRWGILAIPAAIIPGQRPKIARLGFARPGVENWGAGLIHEQTPRPLEVDQHPVHDRGQMVGRNAAPGRQGGAVQIDATPPIDLALAIEGKVVGIF